MQKRVNMLIPPVTGTVDRAEVTDRGIRYIGKCDNGDDFSADMEDFRIAVKAGSKDILLEGDYLMRDSNDRKFLIYNKKSGVFIDLSIRDDGRFILKYGREESRTGAV